MRSSTEETLARSIAEAPSWVEATRCPSSSLFQRPYMGSPWDHDCDTVLSSGVTTLSVVVPCWNSAGTIGACLAAIARSSFSRAFPSDIEVIVCDDGSNDGTPSAAATFRHELDLTVLPMPRSGRAQAVNAGINAASGDVVAVCDSDMILGCAALDELVLRHERWLDAVCFGFRSDVALSLGEVSDCRLVELMHSEAVSLDNRLSFDTPTLLRNPLVSVDWLEALSKGRSLVDSRGIEWRRHRFLYGCLFSARRDFLLACGGMPTVFRGWGYEDTLFAALAEAHGAFLLPVLSAWAHHVWHDIRDPDQWFHYERNRIAYEFLLRAPVAARRDQSPRATGHQRAEHRPNGPQNPRDRGLPVTALVMHRLGRWCEAADLLMDGTMSLAEQSECLFHLRRFDDVISLTDGQPTYWTAVSLLELGRRTDAARALGQATDQTSRYVRGASEPELQALRLHLRGQGLDVLAKRFDAALDLLRACRMT